MYALLTFSFSLSGKVLFSWIVMPFFVRSNRVLSNVRVKHLYWHDNMKYKLLNLLQVSISLNISLRDMLTCHFELFKLKNKWRTIYTMAYTSFKVRVNDDDCWYLSFCGISKWHPENADDVGTNIVCTAI